MPSSTGSFGAKGCCRVRRGNPPGPTPGPTPGRDLSPDESALFEELRAVRRHLAAGKPAYTVLSDQSLHEIARQRPATLAELGNIKGMGPVKLERYGDALLAVVESASPPA